MCDKNTMTIRKFDSGINSRGNRGKTHNRRNRVICGSYVNDPGRTVKIDNAVLAVEKTELAI